ncbi:hypothetical protein ACH4FX_38085 [Streptomyces sp. NPDC018019]|uniref:hypothetical protein n=1 Tax=Streptomyces sp. NPDC018019 TaxID=3365030 RepID=UPI0037A9BBAD
MRVLVDLARGKAFRVVAVLLAVLAVAAGAIFATGTYDRWRDGRAVSRACEGIVAQGELKEFLGVDGRLTSDRDWASSDRADRKCVIYAPDGEKEGHAWLKVTLGQGRPSQQLLTDLGRNESYSVTAFVSPIGNGWRGVFGNFSTPDDRATVVMPCGGKAAEDLVVNLQAQPRNRGAGKSDERRARFARIATQTAVKAAEEVGCKAPPGREIERVPDVPPLVSMTPRGKATGTCAGINAPVLESAADPLAPIEDCFVLDEKGEPSFRLAAYYGPFVQNGRVDTSVRGDTFTAPAGHSDGVYWTSTSCPKQGGTAFYTAETLRTSGAFTKPDSAVQQAALAHFAKRSAQAHGCSLSFTVPD